MNKLSVFYLDDDQDDLMFFEEALSFISKSFGKVFNQHLINDGTEFLKRITQDKSVHRVVFLDINMPVKNGFYYLNELRQDEELSQVPVIMFSTSINEEYILRSQQVGANYYAVKPYTFNELLQILKKVISMDFERETAPPNDFIFNKLLS